jgi:hypothetical protein
MSNECFHYIKKMLAVSDDKLACTAICFGSSGQPALRRSRASDLAFTSGQQFFAGGERVAQLLSPAKRASPELAIYLLYFVFLLRRQRGVQHQQNRKSPRMRGLDAFARGGR